MTDHLGYVLIGLGAWFSMSLPASVLIGRFLRRQYNTEFDQWPKGEPHTWGSQMKPPRITTGQIASWIFTLAGIVLLAYLLITRQQ